MDNHASLWISSRTTWGRRWICRRAAVDMRGGGRACAKPSTTYPQRARRITALEIRRCPRFHSAYGYFGFSYPTIGKTHGDPMTASGAPAGRAVVQVQPRASSKAGRMPPASDSRSDIRQRLPPAAQCGRLRAEATGQPRLGPLAVEAFCVTRGTRDQGRGGERSSHAVSHRIPRPSPLAPRSWRL